MEQTGQAPWLKNNDADDEMSRAREDFKYMRSMYMPMSMEIEAYVSEACDKLEYEGSVMFDEYPDKQALREVAMQVRKRAAYLENMYRPVLEEDEQLQMNGHCISCRGTESWLDNLIWVLLCDEICRRRQRYFGIKRRCRRCRNM